MPSELDPLGPAEAVELYLDHRRPDLSEKSLQNHKYRLDTFVEFCEQEGIENLNDLGGRDLHRYRSWRSSQGIAPITLKTNLQTLRVFLEFCASIEAVEPGLREKVVLPEVSREEAARDVKLDPDLAEAALDHLATYQYASRDHVVLAILWHTGIRLGTLRSFDVDDFGSYEYERDDGIVETRWYLRVRHRPETGTPLKNGEAAEREIAVGAGYAEVIEDYIRVNRPDVVDEHGREPLISSEYGRLSVVPIRSAVYRWTRPCLFNGGNCPHDRDPEECEAIVTTRYEECPSSRSPHGVRRGALTRMLREGTPEQIVGDRSDVSTDVLDQHYDRRSQRERMDVRREFLRDT